MSGGIASGGMIAIAIAVRAEGCCSPDEPTPALDVTVHARS